MEGGTFLGSDLILQQVECCSFSHFLHQLEYPPQNFRWANSTTLKKMHSEIRETARINFSDIANQ